jgi:hypothetical protein
MMGYSGLEQERQVTTFALRVNTHQEANQRKPDK